MTLSPGQTINQRYRIVSLLGKGGFGAVYRAWDINLERPRALKVNLDTSPQAQRQFKREAQILSDLTHPNLPKVIDHFVIPEVGQYLVMEFVEGEDLSRRLAQAGGPLPEAQVIEWMVQICEALEYLHGCPSPVIHRDIKPANIKITLQGKAVLVDFGIAKVYDPTSSTTLGARAITPGYSPQEQYGRGATDARSDVYALGATLYHLLTGKQPPESILRNMGETLKLPTMYNPALSLEVEEVILKAMEMLPANRYASVAEMRAALVQAASQLTPQAVVQPVAGIDASALDAQTQVAARPPRPLAGAPAEKGIRQRRRLPLRFWGALGGAALMLVVLLLLAFFAWSRLPGRTPAALEATSSAAAISQVGVLEPTGSPQASAAVTGRPATPGATWTATAMPILATATHTPPLPTPTASEYVTPTLPRQIVDDFGVPMMRIYAGTFAMGSGPEGYADEQPRHTVELDAFYMDVYEVTNRMFAKFLNEQGNQKDAGVSWLNTAASMSRLGKDGSDWVADPGFEEHPVVAVTWYGARAFCQWRGARLPTEAEWERAARGGLEDRFYPWGMDHPNCEKGSRFGAQYAPCDGTTAPVGSYYPNGFGLFDMAGNVSEWVEDWYSNVYYSSSPQVNPAGPGVGTLRVVRSGSWANVQYYMRVARRSGLEPTTGDNATGFRCVRSP